MKKILSLLSLLLIFLVSCSKDDNNDGCTPINCLNGGTQTADCGCDCPDGYSGSDCGTQVPPASILITKFTIKSFPSLTENSDYWDDSFLTGSNKYPDVFLQVIDAATEETLFISDFYYENVEDFLEELEFIPNTPISIENYTTPIQAGIFDYDSSTEIELMDIVELDLYENNNGFPTTLVFISESSLSIIEVELSYQF